MLYVWLAYRWQSSQPASNQMKMYFSKLYCATPGHYDFATQKKPQQHLQCFRSFYIKKKIKISSCVRELKNELQTHWKSLKTIFLCSAFLAIHITAKCEHGIFSDRALYFRTKMIHLGTLIKKKKKKIEGCLEASLHDCTEDSYWSTTQFHTDNSAQKSNE